MFNTLSIDVEDYFHVSNFEGVIRQFEWDCLEPRVHRNTFKLLEILEEFNCRATFFVLGWVAEKYPDIVRRIDACGHEIACHSYSHKLIFTQTPEQFRRETRRAKAVLEDITGREVIGYRAPSYSITRSTMWALDVLIEEGFRYDSSIFPIYHDRYGISDFERFPHTIKRGAGEILEFPLTTVRMWGINLPIAGGGYFRLLPYPLVRWGLKAVNERERRPAIVYLHPWELDPEQPKIDAGRLMRFRHYINIAATEEKFRRLLSDFKFIPARDLLCEMLSQPAPVAERAATLNVEPRRTADSLSLVIPVFNEEDNVEPLHRLIKQALEGVSSNYEIIFVDDGSRDRTFERVAALREADDRVKLIRLRRNSGQTVALSAGFAAAKGDIILSMDGDLQNDPADIPALLAKIEAGYDLVCGWRKERKDRFLSRKLPSRIANWIIRLATGIDIHDNGCSLKAYRASLIKRLRPQADMHRFIPALASLAGARIAEVVVSHHPRKFGKSKYGLSRIFAVTCDLLYLKMMIGYSSRPATWFSITSLPFVSLGLLFLGKGLYHAVYGNYPNALLLSLLTSGALMMLLAFQLFLFGLIAEMLLKTGRFRHSKIVLAVEE